MGEKIPADQRSSVESKVNDLREAIQGEDKNRMQSLIDSLQTELQALGRPPTSKPVAAPSWRRTTPHTVKPAQDDEDVVEGEFREA
jgi:molecular chaperone DnaK